MREDQLIALFGDDELVFFFFWYTRKEKASIGAGHDCFKHSQL
jgi:hypothetical protein